MSYDKTDPWRRLRPLEDEGQPRGRVAYWWITYPWYARLARAVARGLTSWAERHARHRRIAPDEAGRGPGRVVRLPGDDPIAR